MFAPLILPPRLEAINKGRSTTDEERINGWAPRCVLRPYQPPALLLSLRAIAEL
jgi:hypothetical protein